MLELPIQSHHGVSQGRPARRPKKRLSPSTNHKLGSCQGPSPIRQENSGPEYSRDLDTTRSYSDKRLAYKSAGTDRAGLENSGTFVSLILDASASTDSYLQHSPLRN